MSKSRSRIIAAAFLLLFVFTGCGKARPPVSEANAANFGKLLTDLVTACETPSDADEQTIRADLDAIEAADRKDLAVAESIADHWMSVYADPDFRLYCWQGGEKADELNGVGIPDSRTHAIVVLGYALRDGEMQPELIGRCEAAAAMARSFPSAILACSGGATGENNSDGNTEAGLMKQYLIEQCGIDASRIYTDEEAMTTAENAVNTLKILRKNGIKTMTVVTSSYHQRRGRTLYSLIAELYRQQHGYSVGIVGNYCYEVENVLPIYEWDDRIAVMQMAQILELPEEVTRALPQIPRTGSPLEQATSGGEEEEAPAA